MILKDISDIHSGYISRKKIEASADGSHYLLQARNVDGDHLTHDTCGLLRFNPKLSRHDQCIEAYDLLIMAKGHRHFTVLLGDLPRPVLAAACFFIIRVTSPGILPAYLYWYLNQAPVDQYLYQHTGQHVHMPVVRRAVLENTPIPVPSLDRQSRIADMNVLLQKEMDLLRALGKKRKALIRAVCLQSVHGH